MRSLITNTLATTLLAVAMSAQAAVKSHSGNIVVEQPTDLPESAQTATTAMYLHETNAGEAILYLEQNGGQQLAILNVTDPAAIKAVSRVALNSKAPFDFVQNIGDSAALIRYRDNSGVAVLSFRNYKHPVVTTTPGLIDAAFYEPLGQTGLLLQSADVARQPERGAANYNVVDFSAPTEPATLATIGGVRQRLSRDETGTLFLLNADGVTIVRRPRVEQEYRTELIEMNHN